MPLETPTSAQPRVTVIVTCYQQAHLVESALDSVARQTEADIQLIVTDDGSRDDSVAVIRDWLTNHSQRFPLGADLLALESNRGLPAALNRALPHIRGKYFVVLNGDDWMDDDRVAAQADALDVAGERVGITYCDLRIVDSDGHMLPDQPPATHGGFEGDAMRRVPESTFIGMPAVMARTEVLSVAGPWDESLAADDFDFLMRAATHYHFAYLPRALHNYRMVETSLTNSRGADLAESRIRSLTKFLGRSTELDDIILRRVEDQIVDLHGAGYHRSCTRRHLRRQFLRRPTRRLVRVALENYLRLPPRSLALTWLRQRFWRRT